MRRHKLDSIDVIFDTSTGFHSCKLHSFFGLSHLWQKHKFTAEHSNGLATE